jgi:hypothetical protein
MRSTAALLRVRYAQGSIEKRDVHPKDLKGTDTDIFLRKQMPVRPRLEVDVPAWEYTEWAFVRPVKD